VKAGTLVNYESAHMMSVPGSVVHCIIVFYRFEWMVVRISSHPFAFPEINLFEKKKLKYMKIKNLFYFKSRRS